MIGAFCLSEPEAGSDATSQQTTAVDCGDYYLLNGTKNWITNGKSASVYLVMAQTDLAKGHRGINCLIVEKGMEGFIVGKKEDKLGIRGSDTHSLMFTDVKVPKENRVGGGRLWIQIRHENFIGWSHWYRSPSLRYCLWCLGISGQICYRAKVIWKAHFRTPSHRIQNCGYGDESRSGAPPCSEGSMAQGSRIELRQSIGYGKVVRFRCCHGSPRWKPFKS